MAARRFSHVDIVTRGAASGCGFRLRPRRRIIRHRTLAHQLSFREAFGGKIIDSQGIQWHFAEAAAEVDAAGLICYQAARDLERGGDVQRSSSAGHAARRRASHQSRWAWQCQLCGAHGTQETSPFGRYFRDAKRTKSPAGQPRS